MATETKLSLWETAVRENPVAAETCGPPNWLVCESWKKKADGTAAEPFEASAARVRLRYFPKVSKVSKENVEAPVVEGDLSKDELDGAKRCGGCMKYFTHVGTRCYRCQKKSERGAS